MAAVQSRTVKFACVIVLLTLLWIVTRVSPENRRADAFDPGTGRPAWLIVMIPTRTSA